MLKGGGVVGVPSKPAGACDNPSWSGGRHPFTNSLPLVALEPVDG